jgi:hypothetical protein
VQRCIHNKKKRNDKGYLCFLCRRIAFIAFDRFPNAKNVEKMVPAVIIIQKTAGALLAEISILALPLPQLNTPFFIDIIIQDKKTRPMMVKKSDFKIKLKLFLIIPQSETELIIS